MDITILVYIAVSALIAYIIGSFPTGYILVKLVKGIDIRQTGSGSTGATNVKRVLGTKAYFFVMFVDGFKGLLPVLAAKHLQLSLNLLPEYDILPIIVAIGILIGHSKSVFLGFTGGKSVASGIGTIFGLHWPVGLITMVIWLIIAHFTKIVSISSMTVIVLTPLWMFLLGQPLSYVLYCLTGAVYIVYLHKDNIKRLLSSSENKL